MEYVYDALANVKEVWYTDSGVRRQAYDYLYNANGQLIRTDDLLSGRSTVCRYDGSGKLIGYAECDSESLTNELGVSLLYNDQSQVKEVRHSLDYDFASGTGRYAVAYSYAYTTDGKLETTKIDFGDPEGAAPKVTYSYDGYDRLARKSYNYGSFTGTVDYSFSFNGSYTSSQVATYTSKVGSNDELKYTYTYDGNGNITKITCDGKEIRYVYDDLGQLIREDMELSRYVQSEIPQNLSCDDKALDLRSGA